MKILVLIHETNKKGLQMANDLVGIFETDHIFSQKELDLFNFIEVEDSIVESFYTELNVKHQVEPEFLHVRKYYENGELKFN